MPLFLLVLEPKSKSPYDPLLDVIERRLAGKRILRTSWVIEANSSQAIFDTIRAYLPIQDGLLILPYGDPRVAKNLRSPMTSADA